MSLRDVHRREFGPQGAWPLVITVPARNEEERLPACLDAAARSLRGRGAIVVAVNGSQDATRAVAEDWFRRSGLSGAVLDEPNPPEAGGVGRARRVAIASCAARLAPDAVVMTTDADTCVAGDWVDANLTELEHADLVCGTVLPDPEEAARLPSVIGRNGAPEGEYMALTLAVRHLLDPVPHDPAPTHINPAGASLAFRMALYDALGGFEERSMGEDRAFAALAEARDWRVRHSSRAQVTTSCRLSGRTEGGMAGALRARILEADPLVDEVLEPAATTILRARMRGTLRRRWIGSGFGAAWAALETGTAELRRERMRLSQLRLELPRLQRELARLAPTRSQVSA
ncbi:glycosyltransferase family 2 protein [Oceanicola sp. 502str15]|uniref:glycosyltransferase n=1 Tax=Oceanicola sp. 502str15 TaxID=2696061 RepID=UPI002094F431|nr:glycosyltransferase family 2 protein [Oceanicola sp. 502str15]MCO6383345.1 glycosyltransferase [Oceanicola sp. 502str15]